LITNRPSRWRTRWPSGSAGKKPSIGVTEGLFLCAADPADDVLTEPVVVPSKPGPHTVRVLARGRNEDDYDDVVDVSDEEYQVTFWPTAE
jgi:hypothetical protein